jgi:hypothetical protein
MKKITKTNYTSIATFDHTLHLAGVGVVERTIASRSTADPFIIIIIIVVCMQRV